MKKSTQTALVHITGHTWAVLSICWAVDATGLGRFQFALLAALGFFVSAAAFEHQLDKEDE